MATIDAFLVSLCRRMGWEPTTWRLNVLRQMAQNEGNIDKVDQMFIMNLVIAKENLGEIKQF